MSCVMREKCTSVPRAMLSHFTWMRGKLDQALWFRFRIGVVHVQRQRENNKNFVISMWFIELGLRTYFILKRNRFSTTAIFTGSASTVHNSSKIMFQNVTFRCNPGYDTCLSVLRIPFLE